MGENQVEAYARLLADAALQLAEERAQQIIESRAQRAPSPPSVPKLVVPDLGPAEWPLIMTPGQLAKLLQIHPRTLDRWRAAKPPEGPRARQLPGSGQWRYERDDVIAWWNSL